MKVAQIWDNVDMMATRHPVKGCFQTTKFHLLPYLSLTKQSPWLEHLTDSQRGGEVVSQVFLYFNLIRAPMYFKVTQHSGSVHMFYINFTLVLFIACSPPEAQLSMCR